MSEQESGVRTPLLSSLTGERAILRLVREDDLPRLGVMRSYERGPDCEWRDSLLMDMLAGELR